MSGLNAQIREEKLQKRITELETSIQYLLANADKHRFGRVVHETALLKLEQVLNS